jgi:hypothetical protein
LAGREIVKEWSASVSVLQNATILPLRQTERGCSCLFGTYCNPVKWVAASLAVSLFGVRRWVLAPLNSPSVFGLSMFSFLSQPRKPVLQVWYGVNNPCYCQACHDNPCGQGVREWWVFHRACSFCYPCSQYEPIPGCRL